MGTAARRFPYDKQEGNTTSAVTASSLHMESAGLSDAYGESQSRRVEHLSSPQHHVGDLS